MSDSNIVKTAEGIVSAHLERKGLQPAALRCNVLMKKGATLTGVHVIPGSLHSFTSEQDARRTAKPGQPIFRIDITRIE